MNLFKISKPPEFIQRRVFISGRVQRVGFRMSTREAAITRSHADPGPGLAGFVRNLENGDVEAVFCGPRNAVLWMVAWCHHGPPFAVVERVKVLKEEPDPGLLPFEDPQPIREENRGTVWPITFRL